MKIYIGSDHRGFELKEKIFQWLVDKDYEVEDFGAYEYDPKDDYTIFAEKVGSMISSHNASATRDKNDYVFGILLCGSGVGVDIVANKFDGVRASIGKDNDQVRAGRNDDDMNVLVIASDYTDENVAKEMVETFLKTPFSGKDRYKRRLEEIKMIEENN
jgi:sugar-phosphate isomerases, RpiB/LacA/LacB family